MAFCPIRSTAEKQVECNANCAWYFEQKDDQTTCEINFLTNQLHKIEADLYHIAKNQ